MPHCLICISLIIRLFMLFMGFSRQEYWSVQAPLSTEFSRQKYWSRLPFPPPGSSWPRDGTWVSCISCTGRRVLYHWATWEAKYTLRNINLSYFSKDYNKQVLIINMICDQLTLCTERACFGGRVGYLVESEMGTVLLRFQLSKSAQSSQLDPSVGTTQENTWDFQKNY